MTYRIEHTINYLAGTLGPRPAGSAACLAAADWIRNAMQALGLQVDALPFVCPDFVCRAAALTRGGQSLALRVNRHSPSCDVTVPVVAADSMDTLARADADGALLLLHGALAAEMHFPRNFTFFRNAEQDAQVALAEQQHPAALLFGTAPGGPPFMMEDSEVAIPNVTLPAESTAALLATAGPARLVLVTARHESSGVTLVARNRVPGPRVVLAAHYDTNHDAPGALDNAAGVAAMLETATLLLGCCPDLALECVAFGGEDSWYPGDAAYFEDAERFRRETRLFINFDGPGSRAVDPGVDVASFNLDPAMNARLEQILRRTPRVGVAQPWMQSDHAFAVALGVPTLACSSANLPVSVGLVHTPADTPDKVDASAIAVLCEMFAHELAGLVG